MNCLKLHFSKDLIKAVSSFTISVEELIISYDYNFLLRSYGTRIVIIPFAEGIPSEVYK